MKLLDIHIPSHKIRPGVLSSLFPNPNELLDLEQIVEQYKTSYYFSSYQIQKNSALETSFSFLSPSLE